MPRHYITHTLAPATKPGPASLATAWCLPLPAAAEADVKPPFRGATARRQSTFLTRRETRRPEWNSREARLVLKPHGNTSCILGVRLPS